MSESLSRAELLFLVRNVFHPTLEDRGLAVLVDLPDEEREDHEAWRLRREVAVDWVSKLRDVEQELGLRTILYCYRNARMNNADLPDNCWVWQSDETPGDVFSMKEYQIKPLLSVFERNSILMAVTEFSATAPLKLLARKHQFRAATMGGFSPLMIPALRLDYEKIDARVHYLKGLLSRSDRAELVFRVLETESDLPLNLTIDLRHRTAHASGGLLRKLGIAGNLPSGEAYIVPYEGEKPGEPSRSRGTIPVEFEGEVVRYEIRENRAVTAAGWGRAGEAEREKLRVEPAYGNLAELGLGVIRDFGVKPCGSVLLDEKLGLHLAFGRSDHFGGQVGSKDFSSPDKVVHIDRVYIPEAQPLIEVVKVDLFSSGGEVTPLMRDGAYVVEFPES